MFDYIQGIMEEAVTDTAVVDVNGVGYEILIPLSTYNALPRQGERVKIYIHFHVREDAQKLYGFFTKTERELFRKLISISMIGPKVALSVLSGLSVRDIVSAIQTADVSRLKSISGVGLKTAQRILVELKGKLDGISAGEAPSPAGRESDRAGAFSSLRNDAYAALISLGYNESQVVNALVRVEQTVGKDAPVEEWIKKALKVI